MGFVEFTCTSCHQAWPYIPLSGTCRACGGQITLGAEAREGFRYDLIKTFKNARITPDVDHLIIEKFVVLVVEKRKEAVSA